MSEQDKKKKRGFFYFLGCVFKAIYSVLKVIVIFIWKILKATGLYLALLYALVGLVLYLTIDFNPLLFGNGDMLLECILYAAGMGLCVVFALVISIRNFIVKPLKRFGQGFMEFGSKPSNEDKSETKEEAFELPKQHIEEPERHVLESRPEIEERRSPIFARPVRTGERVKVYYSGMQDRLIREYDDRFEVYVTVDGVERLEKVEYKLDDER